MKKNEKMIIYNLFPLLAGKFTEWQGHFRRASSMGFNWIFINPINATGMSGSLYSVKDYFDFNPMFLESESGKPPVEQVKDMIGEAEKLGLKVMVDLVINHTAVDSDLIREHPEWFLWKANGKIDHPFAKENGKKVVWGDLAKLDHKGSKDKEGLFRYCLGVVRFLADLGFKALRCDAAYQVPKSFWQRLIRETREIHPDVLFLAETLGCPPDLTMKTASAGFDYIFNSSKWWDYKGHWLIEQYSLTREIAYSISFPESHDTVRLCQELHGNVSGIKQRYLFSALFSAGVMMTVGFEFGFRNKPHVVKTRPSDWEGENLDLRPFITEVNGIKAAHSIFREDAPTQVLHSGNSNVLLLWKASTLSQEEALILINRDIEGRQWFYADNLQDFLQARAPIIDISPEHRLDFIPRPFSYELMPGQGLVLLTARDVFGG